MADLGESQGAMEPPFQSCYMALVQLLLAIAVAAIVIQ